MRERQPQLVEVDLRETAAAVPVAAPDEHGAVDPSEHFGVERPGPDVRDAEIPGAKQRQDLFAGDLLAKQLRGVRPPGLPAQRIHKLQVPSEPVVQRQQIRVLAGGRGRQEQGVRPDDALDRLPDRPLARGDVDLLSVLALEEQRRAAVRISVRPFMEHAPVVQDDAVLVTHAVEHEIDLVAGRLLGRLGVEPEAVTPNPFGAEREQHEIPQIVERLEQVGLA
ncbi:hypothetical protein GCM10020001_036170 [Nonomuraea salmonea]